MRVAVYAIAKDEAQNVDRWLEAAHHADVMVVADTGSRDDTVKRLRRGGVRVTPISVEPWRFDTARNVSLALVPADVDLCIVQDLDMALRKGWRQALEAVWEDALSQGVRLTRVYHPVVWRQEAGGVEAVATAEWIHARRGYIWRYPCHEGCYPYGGQELQTAFCAGCEMSHEPDDTKERRYFDLCYMGWRENPGQARPAFYWGRELFSAARFGEAIEVLEGYWNLAGANDYEAPAVALMLERCYEAVGKLPPDWLAGLIQLYSGQGGPSLMQNAKWLVPVLKEVV